MSRQVDTKNGGLENVSPASNTVNFGVLNFWGVTFRSCERRIEDTGLFEDGNWNEKYHNISSKEIVDCFWLVVSTHPKNISQIGSFPLMISKYIKFKFQSPLPSTKIARNDKDIHRFQPATSLLWRMCFRSYFNVKLSLVPSNTFFTSPDWQHTVDGWNPAPPGMYETLWEKLPINWCRISAINSMDNPNSCSLTSPKPITVAIQPFQSS